MRRFFFFGISALFMFSVVTVLSAEQRYDVPVGDSQALGPPNAPVTLVEFVDYQ